MHRQRDIFRITAHLNCQTDFTQQFTAVMANNGTADDLT